MDNDITNNFLKRCDSCDKLINKNAKICFYCKEYQGNKNKILFFAKSYTIPILLAIVSIGQLFVSHSSYIESKQKRVEAEDVLKKAEDVLSHSVNIAKIANETSEVSLNKSNIAIENINSIKKDIDKVKNEFTNNINKFNSEIDKSRNYIDNITNKIKKQLLLLENRNKLMSISDDAIANMNRKSYAKLISMLNNSNDENEKNAIISEIWRIKSAYIGVTRIKNYKLKLKTGTEENNISTDMLISILLNKNEPFQSREKAAVLLSGKKETITPEALYGCIISENNLEVLKECINSFCAITDYKNNDVFRHEEIVDWWYENKNKIIQKIKQK